MTRKDFCISDVSPISNYRYGISLKGKWLECYNKKEECEAFIEGYLEGMKQIEKEALRRSMNMNSVS